MKKFLLSSFVILTFIVYAVHEQLKNVSGVVSVLPTDTPSANTPTPTQASSPSPPSFPVASSTTTHATMPSPTPKPKGKYKDGQYTGDSADAYYGNIQVKISIQNGLIADVQFLDYPQDRRTSQMINSQAMPYLKSEAIQAQSAQVDIVSGATDSSLAFRQSLQSALSKAMN